MSAEVEGRNTDAVFARFHRLEAVVLVYDGRADCGDEEDVAVGWGVVSANTSALGSRAHEASYEA